jgi:hypothetical protein
MSIMVGGLRASLWPSSGSRAVTAPKLVTPGCPEAVRRQHGLDHLRSDDLGLAATRAVHQAIVDWRRLEPGR